jgi:hypothetical protein
MLESALLCLSTQTVIFLRLKILFICLFGGCLVRCAVGVWCLIAVLGVLMCLFLVRVSNGLDVSFVSVLLHMV